jgi:hypothetical protein
VVKIIKMINEGEKKEKNKVFKKGSRNIVEIMSQYLNLAKQWSIRQKIIVYN